MNRARFGRRPRGGAAVETAILMLVLVPLVMYTLFLEDLLFYRMDLAETVFTSAWDYSQYDVRHMAKTPSAAADLMDAMTTQADKQTYWDHTSVWNTYSDPAHDADSIDHHQAMTAHECWLAEGGKQIECTTDTSAGKLIAGEFWVLGRGGQAKCSATLGVQNYFLPQKFFQWWAKQDMTDQKQWKDGNIHGNAHNDSYKFPEEDFSVLYDTWSLNWIKLRVSTDKSSGHKSSILNPLIHPADQASEWMSWVAIPYGLYNKTDAAKKFADDAVQKNLLGSSVKYDGTGDDIDTPPLAWKEDKDRDFGGHGASGWQDQRQQDTYNAREASYLGKPESDF